MSHLPHRLVVFVILLTVLAGCTAEPEMSFADDAAEKAWVALQKTPTSQAYDLFIRSNRTAAMIHGDPNDKKGVRYQVRALEAQAGEAERSADVGIASDVDGRIDELEEGGLLDVYDEVLPGAAERLRAAAKRVLPVLGE